MDNLRNNDSDLPTLWDENITSFLLYGNHIYDDKTNQIVLMHVIRHTKDSQIFHKPPFNPF